MTNEDLRNIFIEEGTEIIGKLDVNIINFEESPTDKDLLNELFRGVHTLKGNANSFGFVRLGEFVHHFEDVLDYYRNSDDIVEQDGIDLFLSAVDIIKEVMWLEIDDMEGIPDGYDEVLEGIKGIISKTNNIEVADDAVDDIADVSLEFADMKEFELSDAKYMNFGLENIDRIKSLVGEEELYYINLKLDTDIYFRGFDYSILFSMLDEKGVIVKSWWDMSEISELEEFDIDKNSIKSIEVFFISSVPAEEIEEIFQYIEEEEYSIEHVQKNILVKEAEPKILEEEDIKFGKRKEDRPPPAPTAHNRRKNDGRSFVKVDTNKLDELFDSVGELVIAQNYITESEDIKKIKSSDVNKTMNILSKITRLIQNRVMSLRMVAVGDTFEKMKRVARDASKKVDKDISLNIEGADTEIDKIMVDALSDPLIHMIRNAIDHGIEKSVDERIANSKPEIGTINLKAFHRGGNIAIEVSDDGAGINRDTVFAKAVERGLVNENDDLSDSQVYALIMQAGFSTADVISDISGRGVGLDVVQSSIEKLHGRVEIASKLGRGTTFTILLPLTLAIIDGMIVKSANDVFIIPTLSVIESFIPSREIVHSIKKQGEFVDLRGDMMPIVRLNHTLEISDDKPVIHESTLICVESEKGKYAVLVDELVGRQQVVIKSLGPVLSKIKELSGSAIMGNGDIALILNVEELLMQGGAANGTR